LLNAACALGPNQLRAQPWELCQKVLIAGFHAAKARHALFEMHNVGLQIV
jgi:hypothetical protein